MSEGAKKILAEVDKKLAEIEAKTKEADAAGQQRADILSGLLERAKKNNCVIVIYNSQGGEMLEITPSKTVPEGTILTVNGMFIRHDPLEEARSESSSVGRALAALVRGQMKVYISYKDC